MPVTFSEAQPLLRAQTARMLGKIGVCPDESTLAAYVQHSYGGAGRTFLLSAQSHGSALAEFHRLDWDSKIYGVEIGAVGAFASIAQEGRDLPEANLATELAARLVESAKKQRLKMLAARVQLDNVVWVQALENAGFQMMDVQCPLVLRNPVVKAGHPARQHTEAQIRDFADHDMPEILTFARAAFGRSHLYADPLLPAELGDQLHDAWIRNDCSGRASFVLVAVVNNRICGLVAGLWDDAQEKLLAVGHGHIDLIAVRSDMRKMGIARQLMSAAIQRYVERGAAIITVSTQATNLAAINLYQSIGFDLAGFEVTLHGWIK